MFDVTQEYGIESVVLLFTEIDIPVGLVLIMQYI